MNHIDTGRVIDEVRIRRCLWDPADDFYKNKDAKNKAWEEIGKELCGENFNTDLVRVGGGLRVTSYFRAQITARVMAPGDPYEREQKRLLELFNEAETPESSEDPYADDGEYGLMSGGLYPSQNNRLIQEKYPSKQKKMADLKKCVEYVPEDEKQNFWNELLTWPTVGGGTICEERIDVPELTEVELQTEMTRQPADRIDRAPPVASSAQALQAGQRARPVLVQMLERNR
ncbi:hypothetical protein RR48_01193 [Papilio machaon]|uniref:MADF domain-containing protein n=1 Tax=Papilio machaon TaxID=76193 RepID=A0A0N1IJP2_PAPMA|nr:hypothetical protein RR48_01193 [Papilio machaon]